MVTGRAAEPRARAARPVAVLIGPPGAGKTTIGGLLAARLGVDLLDTDALVEERAGKTIPDVFLDDGETGFRALERAAVADTLATHAGVVSLGGGAVLDEATQADLAGHVVVFLDVTLRHAGRRSGFDQGRPLLALNPRGRWLALMEQRRPIYERLATLRVDTDGREPDDITTEILARLDGEPGPEGTS